MSKRMKSILVFIVLVILIGLLLHPNTGAVIKVTKRGFAEYKISLNDSGEFWKNRTFYALTVLNGGEGYLNLSVKIKSIVIRTNNDSSFVDLTLSIMINGKIPKNQIPKDLILSARNNNTTSIFYLFIFKNDTYNNITKWPDHNESVGNTGKIDSIYRGYRPDSSNFSATTMLACKVQKFSNNVSIQINVGMYGMGDVINTTVKLVLARE